MNGVGLEEATALACRILGSIQTGAEAVQR